MNKLRHRLAWMAAGSICLLAAATATAGAGGHPAWVAAWTAPPDTAGPVLDGQTVRQVVRASVAGTQLRIRLSNLLGATAVTLGPVRVALSAGGADAVPGTSHPVLFHGQPTVTIAKGESALSDPVTMDVKALQSLAVSLYVPAAKAYHPATIHNAGMATACITERVDATAAVRFPCEENSGSRFYLTGVEVASPSTRATLVAFGDSITDGVGSKADADERWPDYLAARLQADPKLQSVGVADEGIGGNRILHDNYGPSALSRFDRDVLDQPNVRWVLLLEGINDIGGSGYAWDAKDKVSAQQLIAGMQTLVARAHARHVKVYGATLTPYGGSGWPYHSAAGEQVREAVNAWIRHSGTFDGVVDFDKAVRDPAAPTRLLPAYDSGDHLHPNSAGYRAMAAAVDLRLFDPAPGR